MFEQILLALQFLLPTELNSRSKDVDLGQNTVWLEESAEVRYENPEAALKAFAGPQKLGPSSRGMNLGFRKYPTWFLTRIRISQESPEGFAFYFPASFVDRIDLWYLDSGKLQGMKPQGDEQALADRYVSWRYPNYHVSGEARDVYILYRIQTDSITLGTIKISNEKDFSSKIISDTALLCVFWGVMLVMVFYHLFIWRMVKHQLYIIYTFYILANLFTQSSLQGHLYLFFVHDYPTLTRFQNVLSIVTGSLLLYYSKVFLALPKFCPKNSKLLDIMLALNLLVIVAIPVFGITAFNKLTNIMSMSIPFVLITTAIHAQFSGQKAARFYILAFTSMLMGVAVFTMRNLNVLVDSPLIVLALPLGSAIQVTLMSFALGDRMRMIEEAAKEREKQAALEEARHKEEIIAINASLEQKVDEQTRDIRAMLEYTKVGLFSLTTNLTVHKDYARYLENILEKDSLAGASFEEILLEKTTFGPDSKQRILTALEYSLGEDEVFFEANVSSLPQEMPIETESGLKMLDVDWSPMVDNEGRIEKILIGLKDVTEINRLRMEAERGRRNLRFLSEVIEVGPQRFLKFAGNAEQAWSEIDQQIASSGGTLSGEAIRKIYIVLHTIKGITRSLNFLELTDKIHLAEDVVMNTSTLSVEQVGALQELLTQIKAVWTQYQEAAEPIVQLYRQIGASQATSAKASGPSLRSAFAEVERTVGDLAKQLGKGGCRFSWECGPDIPLSSELQDALEQALVHIARNSVDHGLETPEVRAAKGKPAEGTLRVFWDKEGRLCIGDDGAGLAMKRLEAKAQEQGFRWTTKEELMQLIFAAGVSTKTEVSDISGRGVGMDAVKHFLESKGGQIVIVPVRDLGDYMSFYFAISLPTLKAA